LSNQGQVINVLVGYNKYILSNQGQVTNALVGYNKYILSNQGQVTKILNLLFILLLTLYGNKMA